VLLVVFPFTFQFDGRGKRSGPQQILARYAEEEAVPILDLLPRLKAQMKRTREDPKDYFFDGDHPTVRGSEVVADILADFLLDSGLMPSPSS
jgi:lysophospholipase L1-like esterase